MARHTRENLRGLVIKQLNERFCKNVNVQFVSDVFGAIVSQGSREAINSFDNDRELVHATQWYNDYWFFIRIKFVFDNNKNMRLFASVSFFQDVGNGLKQLFRAEWDSFPTIMGYNHPQPHWHFTAQLSDKTSFSDLNDNLNGDEGLFSVLVGNSKTINLDRMHFAMAGQWPCDGYMVNTITDEISLVNWLIHLFHHVREELDYKERTKS